MLQAARSVWFAFLTTGESPGSPTPCERGSVHARRRRRGQSAVVESFVNAVLAVIRMVLLDDFGLQAVSRL